MKRIRLYLRQTYHDFSRFVCDSEFKQSLFPWVLVTTIIFAFSSIIYSLRIGQLSRWAISLSVPLWVLFVIFFVGLYLGMFSWAVHKWENPEGNNSFVKSISIFLAKDTVRNTVTAFIVASVFISICIVSTLFITKDSPIKAALENPGGLFALLTGVATLVGTYFAVHSILEMKHSISSFPQLVDRVTNLINCAEKSPHGVLFFSYSIQPGAWNVDPDTKKDLYDAITNQKVKIEAIVLDEDSHNELLSKFVDKTSIAIGPITNPIKSKFADECEDLICCIEGAACKCDSKKPEFTGKVHRKKYHQMPGFYFFVSSDRAIFAITVEMPRIDNPDPEIAEIVNVEALGFETSDRRIIQILRREFLRYAAN